MASAYPALMIRPPESPLQQFAQVQQIKSAQQAQQLQGLEIQQAQQQMQDRHALTQAMTQWDGQDVKSLPMLVLKSGGSGAAAMQMSSQVLDMRAKAGEIAKNDALTDQANADTLAKQNDERRGRLLNVVQQPDAASKQAAWENEINAEEQSGKIQPGTVSKTYPGDQQATALANSFALGSKLIDEAQQRQKIALDGWKTVGSQLVNVITGQKIGGLQNIEATNKAIDSRWQVMHPGEVAPDQFHLKPGDGAPEFERIDKLLEGTERAAATKAQQGVIDAMRQQTFEMQRDKQDMQAVTGIDPKTGKQVMVPQGQAQQMGLQNPLKASDDIVNKALAARHWLNLANTQDDPKAKPEEMGISQLIDKLDSEGKLGPIASRWNEFMAGKFGAGDPEVAALRAKMGLSTTLLMQAHVGNRGSSQMLEHFEDLANQKKLDGPTLKAAFNAEKDYIEDRAMDPNPPNYVRPTPQAGQAKGAAGAPSANLLKEGVHTTFKNGQTWTLQNGNPVQVQ